MKPWSDMSSEPIDAAAAYAGKRRRPVFPLAAIMPHDMPIWFRGVGISCSLAASGIWGLAWMYFHPERKISDLLTNKQYKRILLGLVPGGVLLAISDFIFPDI